MQSVSSIFSIISLGLTQKVCGIVNVPLRLFAQCIVAIKTAQAILRRADYGTTANHYVKPWMLIAIEAMELVEKACDERACNGSVRGVERRRCKLK
jgi:hypothetical protein